MLALLKITLNKVSGRGGRHWSNNMRSWVRNPGKRRKSPWSAWACLGFLIFPLGLFAGFNGGCSSTPDPKKANPQWTYSPGSLELRFRADKDLNLYDAQGHTLVLCVYQLSDPNGFNNQAKTGKGLKKLLECKDFDKTAVYFQQLIVQPGEDRVLALDRAEKATFVAVAAGYYELSPERSTRLFQIPVLERDEGIFTEDIVRTPGKLLVNLFLGPSGIQSVGSE